MNSSLLAGTSKALKEMSQPFVFDLAKSDLAYYYKYDIITASIHS